MNEYELEEIKREIVESRSLTIKTNNLVNALAADLKSIAKRQQGYERRIVINSATAYVVTIAILMVIVKFAWDARVDAIRSEGKEVRDKLGLIQRELATVQGHEEQTLRSARRAGEYYDLILQNKRTEIIDQYPEVMALTLTRTERALFEGAFQRAKNELSLMAYQAGLEFVRTQRWHEAQVSLTDALKYKEDAAHAPQATYELARALRALGKQRDAIPMLMQLSEASADKEVLDDSTLLLAELEEDIQAYNDAKNTLRTFIRRFPTSPLINDARAKLAELQLYH